MAHFPGGPTYLEPGPSPCYLGTRRGTASIMNIKLVNKLRRLFGGKAVPLCPSCRYDWRSACHNLDRPRVTECDEYKKRY